MKQTAKRILTLCLAIALVLSLGVAVSASGGAITLEVGETETLQASIYANATYQWSSSDSAVSVTSSNQEYATIRGVSAGSATVTVTISFYDDFEELTQVEESWQVTVSASAELELYLSLDSRSMNVGDSSDLMAYAYGGNGSYSYSWVSSNSSVARVSGSGDSATVTALKGGSANVSVTVTSGSQTKTESCAITVQSRNTSTTYDASASATVGSDLSLKSVANSISAQFLRDLDTELEYGAEVRFTTVSNQYGSLRFGNGGDLISSNTSYAFLVFQDMLFQPASSGTFTSGYTVTQGDYKISGSIVINVTGGVRITNVTMNPTNIEMATYSSRYLSLTVTPANAATYANVTWTTSNSNVATVSGSGLSATVTTGGYSGNATITATVTDEVGTRLQSTCVVTVPSGSSSRNTTYNPTLSVTLGSDYYGTSTSDSMAKRFRDVYGYNLDYRNSVIRFSSTGNSRIGVLRLSNGYAISANTNYTFDEWVYSIYFEPVSAGTFSVPYTINYNGNTLSGTFTIYVRGASLSVSMSPTSMSLATYSNQYLSLDITPRNAYYTVSWSSSNANVATVSGNGTSVTVNTKGVAGTATISATVRDANGVSIVKNCTVTVTSSASYSPSVSTTLGVPYTGTGTSSAMIQQFRSLYGVTINNNTAKIRFATTGNNNIATLRLSNGTAVKANTDYTMTQYIAMYTDPVAAGTFSIPYTLTYNNKSLTGNVNVVINPNVISVGVNLNSTAAYPFNTMSANGRAASSILGDTITNSVGSGWSYLRFNAVTSSVGTLYANTSRSALANASITPSNLGNLYFVPATAGTYTATFTIYNNSGSTLATGALSIIVAGQVIPTNPVVLKSPQKLSVNGVIRATEVYNIDGTNYFKVRDLAALLNGTPYQFNVDFNYTTNTIVLRTRTPYTTATGTELQTAGVDNSALAVVSAQSLEIDGTRVSLTAFNIGDAGLYIAAHDPDLRYKYDSATDTAMITS